MRYFCIQDAEDTPVAVVFHDNSTGQVICRSATDSFRRSFDAVSLKISSKFNNSDKTLTVELFDFYNYSWIDEVLEELSSYDYWSIKSFGDVSGSEKEISDKYFEFLITSRPL